MLAFFKALPPCLVGTSWIEEMEKRSRRRTRDLVTQPASQGLSQNEIGCVRISMMAKRMKALLTGRIQKRNTNPLHRSHLACNTRPVHTDRSNSSCTAGAVHTWPISMQMVHPPDSTRWQILRWKDVPDRPFDGKLHRVGLHIAARRPAMSAASVREGAVSMQMIGMFASSELFRAASVLKLTPV